MHSLNLQIAAVNSAASLLDLASSICASCLRSRCLVALEYVRNVMRAKGKRVPTGVYGCIRGDLPLLQIVIRVWGQTGGLSCQNLIIWLGLARTHYPVHEVPVVLGLMASLWSNS